MPDDASATEAPTHTFEAPHVRPLVGLVEALVTAERMRHIERVAALALEIGRSNAFLPEDLDRLEMAALLHDAARDMTDAELLALVPPANALEAEHPLALHGKAARRMAEGWGVDDPVVLGAIEGHVFGVAPDDAVGAALYVADVSEPGRGVNDDVRDLAMDDLWAAYAAAVRSKVEYLRGAGKEIHPATIAAYESLFGAEA